MDRNMEKADENRREALTESTPSNVCPVSGLHILRKPEWTDIGFGTDYRANVSMIGKSILFSRSKGRAKRQDVENLFELNSSILAEEMKGNPYVYIEDFSNLKGASLRARKKYIDNIKKREQIRGVVYYGLSPLLKMSVKLGKHINFFKFDVKIADDYSQAVRLALDMLQDCEIKPGDSSVIAKSRLVNFSEKKSRHHDIVSDPAWGFKLDDYSVKLDVIDGRIIHSLSTGYMEEKHIEPIKTMRRKACDAMCQRRVSSIL